MSSLGFSSKWAASLACRHNLDEVKQAEMAYAIDILALNILNTILVLALGWSLGIFWNTLVCLITIAAFRHNAGGGHSESPWRCALLTLIVFPLLALIARHTTKWPLIYEDYLALLSLTTGFVLLIRYAPVDSLRAPIISPFRRKRLKRLALLVMTIMACCIIGLRFSGWQKAAEIRMCLVVSLFWVSFNLTPWGRIFWNIIDGIKIKPERRCTK